MTLLPVARRVALFALALTLFAGCKPLGSSNSNKPSSQNRSPKQATPPIAPPPASQYGQPVQLVLVPTPGQSVHLRMGTPLDSDPSDDFLMNKPQYALSYNARRNGANWVSWNLNATWFGSAPRHRGRFLTDMSLPKEMYHVQHDDYTDSGFDRGHMVRSEERTRTENDNRATFLMTNILPQRHDLNGGPWLRFEDYCKELAEKQGAELYVIAGPIFEPGLQPSVIGHAVAVPSKFFKIVVVLASDQGPGEVTEATRVISVIMPNIEGISARDWPEFRTSVQEIQRETGYDFLTAVDRSVQAVIESRSDDEKIK